MSDFQSEQLDYDRSGDRTRDLKHRITVTIPDNSIVDMNYILYLTGMINVPSGTELWIVR